jgi:hypothetical protein
MYIRDIMFCKYLSHLLQSEISLLLLAWISCPFIIVGVEISCYHCTVNCPLFTSNNVCFLKLSNQTLHSYSFAIVTSWISLRFSQSFFKIPYHVLWYYHLLETVILFLEGFTLPCLFEVSCAPTLRIVHWGFAISPGLRGGLQSEYIWPELVSWNVSGNEYCLWLQPSTIVLSLCSLLGCSEWVLA